MDAVHPKMSSDNFVRNEEIHHIHVRIFRVLRSENYILHKQNLTILFVMIILYFLSSKKSLYFNEAIFFFSVNKKER